MPVYFNWIYWALWTKPQLLTFSVKWNVRTSFSTFGAQGKCGGDHPLLLMGATHVNPFHVSSTIGCLMSNYFHFIQLLFTLEEKKVGGMIWLKQSARLHCLWLLRPQSSRKNTSVVTALKALGDLMPVATVCHCDGTDLWTNDPSVPFRIMTGRSQIYLGCRELLVFHPPGRRYCRDAGPTPFTIPLPQPASGFIDF